MEFFTAIPDAKAVIHRNGSYKEADLFHMNQEIYAKRGGSYIKLHSNRSTTAKSTYWKTLHISEGVIGTRQQKFLWLPKQSKTALISVNNDPAF